MAVLVAQLREALRKQNSDKFERLTDTFLFHDKDRMGALDRDAIQAVCYEYNVPATLAVVDALIESLSPAGDGRIDYNTFVKVFDWRSIPTDGTSYYACQLISLLRLFENLFFIDCGVSA